MPVGVVREFPVYGRLRQLSWAVLLQADDVGAAVAQQVEKSVAFPSVGGTGLSETLYVVGEQNDFLLAVVFPAEVHRKVVLYRMKRQQQECEGKQDVFSWPYKYLQEQQALYEEKDRKGQREEERKQKPVG